MISSKIPLSCEKVKTIGNSIDAELVVDPVTLEESYEVIENLLNRDYVTKYRLKEDWIFDGRDAVWYGFADGVLGDERQKAQTRV